MTHHIHRQIMPFTAIIGQEQMKLALVLNAINPAIGGVLIRGEKGTAKSSAVRALAEILPDIRVVTGCPFQCDPEHTHEQCDSCHELHERGGEVAFHTRKIRVVTLPIGATEDRVVGTLNMERALREGILALEPGLLAQVNRGVLYIDEVNLLDDHIVDLLLDAAAMGVNVVEREGISVSHPSRFILIGTMNPEEGELRPQLLDRFGLQVTVDVVQDTQERIRLVRACEWFEKDPVTFRQMHADRQDALRRKIVSAIALLPKVQISDELVGKVIEVCSGLGIRTHRAELTTIRTAKTIAAFNGRTAVQEKDIREAMTLALPHRMRRRPFEEPRLDNDDLEQYFPEERKPGAKSEPRDNHPDEAETQEPGENAQEGPGTGESQKSRETGGQRQVFGIKDPPDTREISKAIRNGQVKSTYAHGTGMKVEREAVRGSYRGSSCDRANPGIALDATMRAASSHQNGRPPSSLAITIRDEDIRTKRRTGRTSTVCLFVVDGSGSMGADRRMESAKGAIFSLLQDSYQHRDRVGMVLFGGKGADLVLPLSSSIDYAAKCLIDLPTGGRTPLAAGLTRAMEVLLLERRKSPDLVPLIFLITDGRANAGMGGDIRKELETVSGRIRDCGIRMVVIDTEYGSSPSFRIRLGYCRMIADITGGHYYGLDDLNAGTLRAIAAKEQHAIAESLRAGDISLFGYECPEGNGTFP
jgi:magnesium chelatase subunit D